MACECWDSYFDGTERICPASTVTLLILLILGVSVLSLPPVRDRSERFSLPSLSASNHGVSAAHRGREPSATGSIRRPERWIFNKHRAADGFVSGRGTWKPGPAVGAGRRPRRPLVLTQKTAPTAGLSVY